MALTDNLVSYWKLDEASGNASDATASAFTLTNNGTTGYVAALINNGIDLGTANTTKYLSRTGNLGINGASMSMQVWVKLRTEITSGAYMFMIQQSNASDTRFMIKYEFNGGTRRLAFTRNTPGSGPNDKEFFYNVTLGTANWYHIVLTYDNTTLIGYVDAVSRASGTASGNGSATLTESFNIGAFNNNGAIQDYASAYIDECGLWSRALTPAEVTSLRRGGAGLEYPLISGPAFTKTFNGLAIASVKTVRGLGIESVKTINGLA
jgi:hypothetical protein